MKAILLAAGLGTRLRPITSHTPKCLVPVNGQPLLDYWLQLLFEHGATEVLINTHYLAEKVEQHVRNSPWAGKITLVHEKRLLGTGGTVLHNQAFISNEPVLVAHADNLALFDPRAFWQKHLDQDSKIAMTMMTFVTDSPQTCGIVELDSAGRVQGFHEKAANAPGHLASAAVYICNPKVVDFISGLGRTVVDLSTEVIPAFLGRIATYGECLYLRDIGSPESLGQAEHDMSLLQRMLCTSDEAGS